MHNTLSSPIIISLSSAYKTIMKLIYPLFILIIAIAARQPVKRVQRNGWKEAMSSLARGITKRPLRHTMTPSGWIQRIP